MGSFHCNTIGNKKISFDIIEQLLNESNSDIEKRVLSDYLYIKNLNKTNNCKASLEYKNITNYISKEIRKKNFTKWIKLIGTSTIIQLHKKDNVQKELEKVLCIIYKNKKKKFLELLLNDPPKSIRPLIWLIISDQVERNDKYYLNLLEYNIEPNLIEEIGKDVERTFSNNEYTSEKAKVLYNILYTIPSLDKEIGYCQGLNFIVSFLLKVTFYNEIDCFYLLIYILERIRGYYIQGFPLLKINMYIFNYFFKKFFPKLSEHFNKLEIPNEIWIGKWMQTLFILNVPFNELCRFWDCLFIFGLDFFIAISLSIIHYFENDLLEFKDSTEVIYYLKECLNPKKFENIYEDFDKRIISIDKIINKAKQYYKSMYKDNIKKMKNEYIKNNNMNIKIFDIKYDFDLISKSYLSQSSINFKSNIKYKLIKKKSFPLSFSVFNDDDNDDYEEENEINTNRENISKYILHIGTKNQ